MAEQGLGCPQDSDMSPSSCFTLLFLEDPWKSPESLKILVSMTWWGRLMPMRMQEG